jgi:hypothetical protein
MHPIQSDHAGDRRLRFVFSNSVISMCLTDDATFGDIAQSLGELRESRFDHPIAIDVQFGRFDAQPDFPSRLTTR